MLGHRSMLARRFPSLHLHEELYRSGLPVTVWWSLSLPYCLFSVFLSISPVCVYHLLHLRASMLNLDGWFQSWLSLSTLRVSCLYPYHPRLKCYLLRTSLPPLPRASISLGVFVSVYLSLCA